MDARKRTHKTYREYIREKHGPEVLEHVIRTSTSLAKSQDGTTTIFDHDPTARGAIDYANATDELMTRIREAFDEPDEEQSPPPDPAESAPELSEMLNS